MSDADKPDLGALLHAECLAHARTQQHLEDFMGGAAAAAVHVTKLEKELTELRGKYAALLHDYALHSLAAYQTAQKYGRDRADLDTLNQVFLARLPAAVREVVQGNLDAPIGACAECGKRAPLTKGRRVCVWGCE